MEGGEKVDQVRLSALKEQYGSEFCRLLFVSYIQDLGLKRLAIQKCW